MENNNIINYEYKSGTNNNLFIAFHGTGGDAKDLLPILNFLDQDAYILSMEGNSLEEGNRRFFKRNNMKFDLNDLNSQANYYSNFISNLLLKYNLDEKNIILLGYSNGANFIIKLILDKLIKFNSVILMHPMYPFTYSGNLLLKNKNIFISAGKNDPIVSNDDSLHVKTLFSKLEANVDFIWTNSHYVEEDELMNIKNWISKI